MATQPSKRIRISNFPGLVDNSDPADLQAGAAQIQINMTGRIDGLLGSRRGFRITPSDSVTLITSLAEDA